MDKYNENATIFKALSDATRLQIVDMLSCGELCACVILEDFQITQPTLSYHMKILTKVGLVQGRKEGSWVHYKLNKEVIERLNIFFDNVTREKADCICHKRGEACGN